MEFFNEAETKQLCVGKWIEVRAATCIYIASWLTGNSKDLWKIKDVA